MICLYIFAEEESFKVVSDIILPQLIDENISFKVYPHQGKQDLEKAIKNTVPTISKIPGARIIITRDQDQENCLDIKKRIDDSIKEKCNAPYKIRILCRQLENWFLGDLGAIEKSYSGFKASHYENKAEYRDIDSIQNAAQVLQNLIPEFKNQQYLPKLKTAQTITTNMDITSNRSKSFQNYIKAIQELIQDGGV